MALHNTLRRLRLETRIDHSQNTNGILNRYCGWTLHMVQVMAPVGKTRRQLAPLPAKRPRTPSVLNVRTKNDTADSPWTRPTPV